MNNVIITGGNGLVGSRVVELLSDKFNFQKASRETGINITKKDEVFSFFKNSNARIVIHMAAKADVDGCETDKDEDSKNLSLNSYDWEDSHSAYGVNVYGTKNVLDAADKTGKKIIYISTDFVFDGEKEEPYAEEDLPNPINWYANTKYLGEREILKSNNFIIARIAYPYRASFEKKDFVRAIMTRFQKSQEISGITDHIMTPTYIDDIANALEVLIKNWDSGTYHVVGSSFISPFEAAGKIASIFGFDASLIKKTTRAEFFANRAPRPFHLALKNDKIARLGVRMRTFEEGLLEIKKLL